MLKGKKILLGITGSIAAYKSAFLIRLLIRAGAEVKVIMTPASTDFISKLTLSTLSKNKVLIDLFDEESWANHVMLGRWADIMLIAPLSCNTLSKMAHGQCDNLLLAVYLSATCTFWVRWIKLELLCLRILLISSWTMRKTSNSFSGFSLSL